MLKVFSGNQPDITPGQVGALVTFIVGQAVAFGLVNSTSQQMLISIGSIVVSAVWKIADAYLRGSRAKAKGTHKP